MVRVAVKNTPGLTPAATWKPSVKASRAAASSEAPVHCGSQAAASAAPPSESCAASATPAQTSTANPAIPRRVV
ncbi:hypothetical protein ACFH04_00600 [Streptomyces noboritoensis]|uniref:Uncharacterized protein n=1 Tax=Streptomyces noboritoensis TaxID=67337 RepID=A0ABV6T9Z5_9ACTN